MQALFTKPSLELEKVAIAGKVGDAAEAWPQELLDLFYEEHPYLADAEVTPVLRDVNDERGYAIGAMVVKRKPQVVPRDVDATDVTKEIRFPIVLKDKESSPFDVFIVGETFHPATEKNIQAALFRPDLFDITRHMPGDISMVNMLYPPYRSRYGFGTSFEGGVGGKMASAQPGPLLDQVLYFASAGDVRRIRDELEASPQLKQSALQNPAMRATLAKLADFEELTPQDMIATRRQAIIPDVIQVHRVPEGIRMKFAHSQMFAPQVQILSMKEAASVLPPDLKAKVMMTGSAIVSTQPVVRESFDNPKAVRITTPGIYRIQCSLEDGDVRKLGRIFTDIVDFNMTSLPVILAVFTDGTWALQDEIAGLPITDATLPESLTRGHARVSDYGATTKDNVSSAAHPGDDHKRHMSTEVAMPKLGTVIFMGQDVVTVPISIVSIRSSADGITLHGRTLLGEVIDLVPSPNLTKITKLGANKYAIPDNLKVLHLSDLVRCPSDPIAYIKVAEALNELEILSGGQSAPSYTFRGPSYLKKFARADLEGLSYDDAMFMAASFGIETGFADRLLKQADRRGMVSVRGVRPIVTEMEKISRALEFVRPIADKIDSVRCLLLKEAALMPSEETVDKVLSLNFMTPENLMIFYRNIPQFQATVSELAHLLVGTRLGLENIPESAVQRSMQSLQAVIDALMELRYNQPS